MTLWHEKISERSLCIYVFFGSKHKKKNGKDDEFHTSICRSSDYVELGDDGDEGEGEGDEDEERLILNALIFSSFSLDS